MVSSDSLGKNLRVFWFAFSCSLRARSFLSLQASYDQLRPRQAAVAMTILNSFAAAAGRAVSRQRPRLRVSAAGQPFVAVLRRIPGIGAMKVSKVSAELRRNVPFIPPHYHNASTVESYFLVWPRRRAAFVMYGGDAWGAASASRICTKASGPGAISRRAFSSAAAGSSGSLEALAEAVSIDNKGEIHSPYASLGSASPSSSADSPQKAAGAGAVQARQAPAKPFSTTDLARKFRNHEPLTMVTAYVTAGAAFSPHAHQSAISVALMVSHAVLLVFFICNHNRCRYDCGGGYLATCANIDMVLCGDSLGMVVCGQDGTVGVT